MQRMEPAMRGYLTTMREQAFIDIKPGYSDSGASAKETSRSTAPMCRPRRKEEEGAADALPRKHTQLPAKGARGTCL